MLNFFLLNIVPWSFHFKWPTIISCDNVLQQLLHKLISITTSRNYTKLLVPTSFCVKFNRIYMRTTPISSQTR